MASQILVQLLNENIGCQARGCYGIALFDRDNSRDVYGKTHLLGWF